MVKKLSQTNEHELLMDILRLRYGNTAPNMKDKAHFSYPAIAKHLKTNLKMVTKLVYKHFKIQRQVR